MYFTGSYGVISHLRTCLNNPAGGTYNDAGQATRVSSAADVDTFLQGQTKFKVPFIMCTLGNETVENTKHSGAAVSCELVERLDIYVALNAKTDKVGKDAADQVHQVRNDLLSCLYGWNPSRAAECADPPVPFGYCSKLLEYVGHSYYTDTREFIVWEFSFELRSTITNQGQGFGTENPIATEPLERIYADFNPTEVTASENPFPQARVE